MGSLVGLQPDALNKFLFSVAGKGLDNEIAENKNNLLIFGLSTHWVFVFFFRLYMSCQSLYRLAMILMPSDLSREMSAAMGDSFASYSGTSLLVVIQSISNIYCKNCATDSWSLTYVMHAMAVRRLVDLNRHIKSSEYVMQNNKNLVQVRLLDDAGLSRCHKRIKKLERHISTLREEATGLTGFMMEHLSLVSEYQQPIFTPDDTSCNKMVAYESDEWDFNFSSLNKKSLPTAIWWILCHNIDTHVTKKNLKTFISLLIQTSLPCARSSFGVVREHNTHADRNRMKKVTLHQISSQCFIDSILYEQRSVYAVLRTQESFSKDNRHPFNGMMLSLMDHTFYVFLTSSKYQLNHAVCLPKAAELNAEPVYEHSNSSESEPCLDPFKCVEARKCVAIIAKILTEQMQGLLFNLKEGPYKGKLGIDVDALNLNKFSSLISCLSGFLWGLAFVVNLSDARNSDHEANSSRRKLEPITELNLCINSRTLCDAQNIQKTNCNVDSGAEEFLTDGTGVETDIALGGLHNESGAAMTCSASPDIHDNSGSGNVRRRKLHLKGAVLAASALTNVDSFELQFLNKPLLRRLLKGDYLDAAFLLRQLFVASSAILRVEHQNDPLSYGFSEASLSGWPYLLDELKLELHLLSALQAIEREVVGVWEGCTMSYDIHTGSVHGGKVSSFVAAGLDCLDLVLEFVSGRKRLKVVQRHIHSFIASAFNVILHLQSPVIFYERMIQRKDSEYSCNRCFKISSECEWCVATLEASVRVLLHCLETVDADAVVKKGFFAWEVAEGVKCAGSLRRIHEEVGGNKMGSFSPYFVISILQIRHQKEVFGPHCAQFLSNYIWIYSGYGPCKTGIKREIDEALRPGVYALIDTCSPDDLQRLHTIFGGKQFFLCQGSTYDLKGI
ncbi:unnamed protein product [Malus baccata var. baccata]